MRNKTILVTGLIFTFCSVLFNFGYGDDLLTKINWSLLGLFSTALLTQFVTQEKLVDSIKNKRVRYNYRKITSLIAFFLIIVIILVIWSDNTAEVVAAYSFFAAAIAFSVQDVFKNLIGGVMIITQNMYQVGDRIQIEEVQGDVVDIGIFYTAIYEIQSWVAGDQPTGRIVSVPNFKVIVTGVNKYNQDHSFIWDEIHIPVTYDSNWRKAQAIIQDTMDEYIKDIIEVATIEIDKLEEKYFLNSSDTKTGVYVQMTDNWISLYGRYVTYARERRMLNSLISEAILEAFQRESDIKIASSTIAVTTFEGKKFDSNKV